METKESAQSSSTQEKPSSPEKQIRGYLLRRVDSIPITVPGQEREQQITVNSPLPKKSIVKLPDKDGVSYHEVIEPGRHNEGNKFNSVWLQEIPISESDFRLLSEKRKGYNLYTLPLTDETKKNLGVEETIPDSIKEELIEKTKGMEGMYPSNNPEKAAPDDTGSSAESKKEEQEESFKAGPGRKLDPERLRGSLENAQKKDRWKGEETKEEPEKQPAESYKAMGGAAILKKIEKARELLNEGRYDEAEKLVEEMKSESTAAPEKEPVLTKEQKEPILENMPEGQEGIPIKETEVKKPVDYIMYQKTGAYVETERVRSMVADQETPIKLPPLSDKQILKINTPVGEAYYKKMEFGGPVQQRIAQNKVPENINNPFFVRRIESEEELEGLRVQGYEVITPEVAAPAEEELPRAA